ncbi:MAG: SET domain-containing protein [Candidatus Buchananbacteria bacterium]
MANELTVKKSRISGLGVFANRAFKKGEIVVKWPTDNILSAKEAENLPAKEKPYLIKSGRKYILMQSPARYVNHSCDANTKGGNKCDVAVRDIKNGEEITSDYYSEDGKDEFICKCRSKKCKKIFKQ